jgi:hypothetical protein
VTTGSKPRVLAFADVRSSLVAAARVHTPLQALLDAGLIESFAVADATLRDAPRDGSFDVLWLQRAADPWLARTLTTRLPGRFLLDVDDHLLCRPSYLRPSALPSPGSLGEALRACRVLTTPSARLTELLAGRAGLPLNDRAFACPNAVPFGEAALRTPTRPAAVMLAQGHKLALDASRHEILTAIVDGARRHHVPLWVLGELPRGLRELAAGVGARLQTLRPRTWEDYHRALAGEPTLLGAAPLETRGDPDTVEFVSGKSDVKMVEFGGFGHPAVYSDAAPYAGSDLSCGALAANDAESWTAAIDRLMTDGWRAAADEARDVRERRDLALVARTRWWPAIEAARLEEPVRAAELFSGLDRAHARLRDRMARARWRLGSVRRAADAHGSQSRRSLGRLGL